MHITNLLLIAAHFAAILATPVLIRRARKDPVPIGPPLEWFISRATLYYGDEWGYNWIKRCADLRHQVALKAQEDPSSMGLKSSNDKVDKNQVRY